MADGQQIRLGLVGVGKIARDQHIPAMHADGRYTLAATASPSGGIDGVPNFPDIQAMLASGIALDAVSLATPPAVRQPIADAAIAAGLHVMLEKPPAASLSQVEDIAERAAAKGVSLFASWHSRQAAAVDGARDWLKGRRVTSVRIAWKEDIRHWHPGQDWILATAGFGVFDPGINALSILTAIMPEAVVLDSGWMEVPEGRQGPLRAELKLRSGDAPIEAELSFLQTGPQTWDILVEADGGSLALHEGGSVLVINGEEKARGADQEYPRLYARFAELIRSRQSDVDIAPFRLVADAFLLAERRQGAAFSF